MVEHSITIPVPPRAWARVKRGRYGQAYTPPEQRLYQATIGYHMRAGWAHKPMQTPLRVDAKFYLERPKSVRRKYPSARPDLDNYLKNLLDAGSGVVWVDDAQVIDQRCTKAYCEPGERPRIELSFSALE